MQVDKGHTKDNQSQSLSMIYYFSTERSLIIHMHGMFIAHSLCKGYRRVI